MRGDVHIGQIVHELSRHDLLPAIVFRTSRNQCNVDAQRASTDESLRLAPDRQREMQLCVRDVMKRYEMDAELITTHPQYNGLVATAIGAHHAGQLLTWRLLLEELMAKGHLRVLVATGTVAAGVDFPARTVVITAHSRRGAGGFSSLTATEFQQMSGRAGRRGKDAVGFCIAAPAPFCDARVLLRIAKRAAEPLVSAYFPSPSTVLNLLHYRNVDDLRFTVERSFAAFIDRKNAKSVLETTDELERRLEGERKKSAGLRDLKRLEKKIRRLRRQAEELEGRQMELLDASLEGLQQLGYVEDFALLEKGYWAANLCTSLVLEIAEIIDGGMLENVSTQRLVAIVASIAGDAHRKYLETKSEVLSKEDLDRLTTILERVRQTEMPGIVESLAVVPAAAHTVLTWMQADSWAEFRSLLLLTGVAEGDAARLITQTADHLNQITRLYDTHPKLAHRAEEGKRLILRPPLTEAINLEQP